MDEKPHKRLETWRRSVDLVIAVYEASRRFPEEERFGLTAQIQRAAVSVPSNIAEVDRLLNGLIASVRRKVAAALTCTTLLLGMVGWLL